MASEIRVTGYIRCAPDEIERLREAVEEHVRLTRAEPGCLSFDISQDADDPCRWTVDETFVDAAAFEAHRARTRASGWPSVTSHMVRDIQVSE
jgi:quinol monooxygenase YgiN